MKYAISNGGRSARLAEKLEPGEVEWLGELPGNPSDEFDTGLTVDAGRARRKTAQEYAADDQVAQAKEVERIESDAARAEAKQAYSNLEPLLTHKDPAIALLAGVMVKHILATLGR